ncbi:MAG: YbjQ family protein [Gemmatimonadota bacterium]
MIVTTTPDIQGRRVTETLGMVRGNTIRARFIGSDIMAAFRALAGGEIGEYTKMLAEAREQAIDRMIEEAEALGADAVVMTRFQTSEIMKSAAEILCYGTAVRTEAVEAATP